MSEQESLSDNHKRILRNLQEQLSYEELSPFDIEIVIPPNGAVVGISMSLYDELPSYSARDVVNVIRYVTRNTWEARVYPNKTIIMRIACKRPRSRINDIVEALEDILNKTVVTCSLEWGFDN